MKMFMASAAIVLFSAQAWAGGTVFKTNMVAYTPICEAGTCLPLGSICATNTDCYFGSFSPKSKMSISGLGELKLLLKDVVDSSDSSASGEYVVGLSLSGEQESEDVTVKVMVEDGTGKATVDLSTFMGPAGDRVFVYAAGVFNPGAIPSECPGTNSVEDITARQGACAPGESIGVFGVFSSLEEKTLLKSNVTPFQKFCLAGVCNPTGAMCTNNSDCFAGTLSAKSKASLSGAGKLKIRIKGVLDILGNPGAGDYILYAALQAQTDTQIVTIKVPVDDGKGKADVDLSGFMQSGQTLVLFSPLLREPPSTPEDCPGAGNSVDDIVSRQGDLDCQTGPEIGTIGVTSGL